MAIFLKNLRKVYPSARLVLPIFNHLYHWKSNFRQSHIFWNHFFDLDSLKLYTDVIDLWEFFDEMRRNNRKFVEINEVYRLSNFEEMLDNGVFIDKFEEKICTDNFENESYNSFEYYNISEKTVTCLNFQGSASLLINVLDHYSKKYHQRGNSRIILITHAEIVLHDFFGDQEYWKARRSMRFNKYLQGIGNAYRMDFLSSTDHKDRVQRPEIWTHERPYRGAIGGAYVCVHVRRADFCLWS